MKVNKKLIQNKKNEKGFTMVELIVVVAIIGIVGALLVPTYGNMAAKARLTTDISSVKTLSRICESYKAEKGSYPNLADVEGTKQLDKLANALEKKGYLDEETTIELQTGADIEIDEGKIKLDTLNLDADEYADAYEQIDDTTKGNWCNGIPGSEVE